MEGISNHAKVRLVIGRLASLFVSPCGGPASLDGHTCEGYGHPRTRGVILLISCPRQRHGDGLRPTHLLEEGVMRGQEQGWLRIVLASNGPREEHAAFVADRAPRGLPYVLSTDLGMAYRVNRLPLPC